MKVWLYYRLSRDEDDELNSLTNQRKIIYEYAVTNGHEVVGESFDDNVSGIKAPFRTHLDVYENGMLTEQYGALDFDWDRLAQLLYGDGIAG